MRKVKRLPPMEIYYDSRVPYIYVGVDRIWLPNETKLSGTISYLESFIIRRMMLTHSKWIKVKQELYKFGRHRTSITMQSLKGSSR